MSEEQTGITKQKTNMAYVEDEKSTGLDTLTTLAQNDLHIVGDVSDSGRAKAITEANLEVTIANSTNFIDELTDNATFITNINTIAPSPLTTKGDVFTYSTESTRLPVGTNGQVLSADSAETTGLKWIDASSGGSVNVKIYSVQGDTLSLTTLAGEVVTVWAKGDVIGGAVPTIIELKYNGVTKDTVDIDVGTATNTGVPFALEYTETPGALTHDITVTTDLGTLENVVIIAQVSRNIEPVSTYISTPVLPYIDDTNDNMTFNDNTSMFLYLISVPNQIEVNDISVSVSTVGANGTLSFAVYSEDGQAFEEPE